MSNSPIVASVSVPVDQQEEFKRNKYELVQAVNKNRKRHMSFSHLVRLLVQGEITDDGNFLVVPLK